MEAEERALSSSAFGTLLRRHRLAAGLSQEALAERARMSVQGISALERGVRRKPQRETLALLAAALALAPAEQARFEAAVRPQRTGPRYDDADRPYHNLPSALTSFHGRERELVDLSQLLASHRLVTLTGAGGIGKTRLALEAAFDLVTDRADGVWFVELAPLGAGSFIASAIAKSLSVREIANQPLLETLLAILKKKHLMLILDNCEHVVEDTARIAEALLRDCPGLRILATSREPLRIAGERSYRLPSLTFPATEGTRVLRIDDAETYSAIALFVERAQAADHRFALTDENAPIVADIGRRLDGIPLAIELAAARVTILSVQQLSARLGERFHVLTGGNRAVLPRHQTLRALIDWSYDLLDERERELFRRLGVFVNGFTLEGAVAVGGGAALSHGDVFEVLASLVDKSLVLAEQDCDAFRFRMLQSTRTYACEKLEEAGAISALVQLHLHYLRDLFVAAKMRSDRSGHLSEFESLFVAELDDVRAALDGVAAVVEPEIAAELLVATDTQWDSIGLRAEGTARFERCIAMLQSCTLRLKSRLWNVLAMLSISVNDARALKAASVAVNFSREADDREAQAQALNTYAKTLGLARNFGDAELALEEAESLATAPEVLLCLRLTSTRAFLCYLLGDLDRAGQHYRSLRKIHTELQNLSEANRAALNVAEYENACGETEKAVATLADEALPALRRSTHRAMLLQVLSNLAGYLVALDRLSEAREIIQEALRNSSEYDRSGLDITIVLEHAALTIALEGHERLAARLAGYTEAAFSRLRFKREITEQNARTRLENLLIDRLPPDEQLALQIIGSALSSTEAVALLLDGDSVLQTRRC